MDITFGGTLLSPLLKGHGHLLGGRLVGRASHSSGLILWAEWRSVPNAHRVQGWDREQATGAQEMRVVPRLINYYIKNAPAKGPKSKKVLITRFLGVTSPFP